MIFEEPMPIQDVIITIKSAQTVDGEDDKLEFITQGTLMLAEDGVRLSYTESELTGLDGTRTDFLITDGAVILSRRGDVSSRMVFRVGSREPFSYDTPYGTLAMHTDTYKIKNTLSAHGGSLEIEYDLDLEKTVISRNRFCVEVREKGNKEHEFD